MKVTFGGKKGCRNATTDFDKLFFISEEHALHLCLGLMKEERALLFTKPRRARVPVSVRVRPSEALCVPVLCNPRGRCVCPFGFLQMRRSY